MEKQADARGQQLQQKGESYFEGPRKLEVKHNCQDARSIWLPQEEERYENLNRQICWCIHVTEIIAVTEGPMKILCDSLLYSGLCHGRDFSSLSLSMIPPNCLSSEKLQQGHWCVNLSLPHTFSSMCKKRQNLACEGLHHKVCYTLLLYFIFYG